MVVHSPFNIIRFVAIGEVTVGIFLLFVSGNVFGRIENYIVDIIFVIIWGEFILAFFLVRRFAGLVGVHLAE
jgi:hypothetical protein